jgi:DNA topoisomerase-1
VGCTNYPECKFTRQMTAGNESGSAIPPEGIELGLHPDTGEKVTRRMGRFGPYLQLGEVPEGSKEKPKRASIPRAFDPVDIDLETALKFLSLPREIGIHPETQLPIVANFGRFGPFILHDGTYVNLESADEVFTVGINRAVDMLAAKKAKGFTPRGRAAALKDLGAHPDGTGNVQVFSGKYGPYVKHGKINATLPKDKTPETVTLDEAVALIEEREMKGGGKRKPARKAAKKAPAKKVAAKKSPAKRAVKKPIKKAAA